MHRGRVPIFKSNCQNPNVWLLECNTGIGLVRTCLSEKPTSVAH